MSQHLFVSHADADLPWAEWIAWELEQVGYRMTIQTWDFRPGSNVVLEVERATREADRVLVLLSSAYLECRTKQPEWAAVFLANPLGQRLVPVRIRPCKPDGFLGGLLAIDLVGLDESTARARLIEGLGVRPLAVQPPPFPGAVAEEAGERPSFPGQRTPRGNIPHLPNPNFTGREDLLLKLREKLASGRTTVLTQTLSGLGGVGKTQLAVHYAYEHAAEYRLVWWLRAEESPALASDFASLARHLGLPERGILDQREVIAAVRLYLESHDRWLLVFDNAEEPRDLRPYIPRSGSGHVLITSRNPIWRGLADSFAVPPFERSESLEFLLRTTGQEKKDAAVLLAEVLGHLPLALDQAASYIHATGISVAEYCSLFERYSIRLLNRGQPTTDYPSTVATTWEISFDKVRRLSPAAEGLLNVFAFLGAEAIPRRLLQPGAINLPEALRIALDDPLTLHDAILAIRKYSLVSVQPESYNIHRLVQAVIQDRLRDTGEVWVRAAASLVDLAFPFDHDDPATWDECLRLLPHAVAVSSFRQFDLADAAAEHLFWRVGRYLSERGDFADAQRMLEDALRIHEAIRGTRDPGLIRILADLALVEQALGKFDMAKKSLEQALLIQASNAKMTPEYSSLLGQKGLIDLALGQPASARQSFEEALAILQKTLGTQSPGVAVGIGNLGLALHALGKLDSARECQEQALDLLRKGLPARHPAIAVTANNLGLLLVSLGQDAAARKHLAEATVIDQATYGQKHPTVAIRMANRALAASIRGEGEIARQLLESVLPWDEAAFGPSHPRVAAGLNSLALRRRADGDLEGARTLLERALSILEKVWDENHPDLAVVCTNLGHVFRTLDVKEARRYFDRALLVAEVSLGKRHPFTARILNDLGGVLTELGDLETARECLKRAVLIGRKSHKERPLEQALIHANLGGVLESLGLPFEAWGQYKDCLRLAQKAGLAGQRTATLSRGALARVLEDLGERSAALKILEQAVVVEEGAKPLRPLDLTLCLNNLAGLLAQDRQSDRARKLLAQAFTLCELIADTEAASRIRRNLAGLDLDPRLALKQRKASKLENFSVRFDSLSAAGFVPVLAGISLGGEATWGMAAGNMAGWALAETLVHSAADLSHQRAETTTRGLPVATVVPNEDVGSLFMRHAATVRRFFKGRGLSEADCEDLTQDVFLDLCRTKVRNIGGEVEWLRRLATRRYNNHQQALSITKRRDETEFSFDLPPEVLPSPDLEWRNEREIAFSELSRIFQDEGWFFDSDESEDLSLEEVLWSDQEDPLDMLLRRELSEALYKAVSRLPTSPRRVLKLHLMKDLTSRQIAELLRLSSATVRVHLHHARQSLRQELKLVFDV